MRFIMKHMSKKMLSVILALMILLSAVSVAFSAIANAAAAPYVVTMEKPAIAMQSGYTLDLNKINVEFGVEEVPGDEITWEVEPDGAVKFNSAASTVTVLKAGTYTLTATKTSDTTKSRTVYLLAVDGEPTTDVVLYEHTFTADDLTTEGEFTTESGWKTVKTEGTGAAAFANNSIITNDTSTSVYYVLNPASADGIKIGAFADISLETTIYTAALFGKNGWYGPAARVTNTNSTITSGIETWYRFVMGTNASLMRFNTTGDITADTGLDILPGEKKIPTNTYVKFKIELNGDKMNAYYDLADGNGYVKTADESNLSASQKTAFEATAANGGTIAVYSDSKARVGVSSVKVSVAFTESELEKIANACEANNFYTVTAGKPAIAMLAGKTINLNQIIVEFDDGSIALGDEITWSVDSKAVILDATNGNNSLTVFKAGTFELTATKTADSNAKKTIYLFAMDSQANEITIFDYAFSAADAGLAVNDANGKPIWSYSGTGSWGWQTATGGAYTTTQPRLRNDGGSGIIYLNPESEDGKVVSSFADYTFYLTAVTHENWTNPASYTKYFPMLTRYTMAGETYDLAADTYLGYRAYFTTNGGAVLVGNTAVANSTLTYPYVNSNPHVDFKLQVEGAEVIFSAKPTNVSEYTQVFKMSDSATVPAAVTATVGKAGTIGVYTDTSNRPSLQKAKVTLSFSDADYEAIEKCYIANNYYVVSAAKPAIPMKLNTKLNLDNLVVEVADGEFMLGTDIAWESTSGTLVYDAATNSVAAYRNGNIVLKAKKSATDTTGRDVYILVNNEVSTEIELFSYTFSSADTGTADANGVYAFGSDAAEKPWKFYTSANTAVGWSAGGVANGTGIANATYAVVNSGINIGATSGYLVLNPESTEGKLISSMADITFVYRATLHPNFVTYNNKTARVLGRYQIVGDTPNYTVDTYLGYHAPWSNTTKGGVSYTGNITHVGNAIANPNYKIVDLIPALSGATKQVVEGDLDFKLQYKGEDFSFAVKGADSDDSGYTTLYTMSADPSAPAAAKATAGHGGTFAMYTDTNLRVTSQYFRASVSFDEAELAKLSTMEVAALYNLTQNYPAVPVNQGNKIMLKDILVELPNGEFITGDNLDWTCAYVGSAFFVDNTEKAVYAYGEGRYDVTIKNGNDEVMTAYFLVSADGVYRLFNHTFTKADYDALAATGKSDMWIASFHSNTNEPATALNGTAGWATQWTNTISPLTSANSQFDENRGISLYSNTAMLLTLNPEYPDAKIIAKFADYNIDFTSAARDKQPNGSPWTQTGRVGALGRIDFGDDGDFDFLYSRYLIAYSPGSLQYGRLSLNVGSAVNYSVLHTEADSYTWSCSKEGVTLDDEAGTLTANAPGIYHIVGTKSDNTTTTVSIIVGSEAIDHHILGAINVTATPSVSVGTPEGKKANNYLCDTTFNLTRTGTMALTVPETYNYRVALRGNDIAMYIAPNGTTNYTEIYNSAIDPNLDATLRNSIATGNRSTGTIALYSEGGSRAFFKSVSVSLDFDAIPSQTSLGECFDEDSRLIYLQVGQTLDLTQVNFEAGVKYYNGANITFSNVPTGLTVVPGVSITPTAEGVYTLNAKGNDGTDITITVAVSAAGSIYNNGNYKFTHSGGIITGYTRIDEAQPYSEYVLIPSELDGVHIYEIGSALAVGNPNNAQLVEVEIEKYIEKIGSGAFIGATKLQKVTIPNTVEEIGASAFAGTTSLQSVFIPGSVSVIGEYAFQNSSIDVVISNPDAVIGKDAFTVGAIIYGFAGSTAEAYANANGIPFVELTGTAKTQAEDSYNEWVKFEADRYTKVNESVEWSVAMTPINGVPQYRIDGFKFTDRSAGKFVFPSELEITENGEPKTVKVYIGQGAFDAKHDSRAIYAVEAAEGVTSVGMWAFRDCYNLKYVKLPSTLTSIGQQAFMRTAIETIDIPDAVITIGLYAFDHCKDLKEVNINPETSRLQALGMNAPRPSEQPGRFLYETQVKKFVFPVTVEVITNAVVNYSSLNEVWVYNKDAQFIGNVTGQDYFFAKNTIIHGVPGSTAEALVRADEALKDDPDPNKSKNYRGLVFVGDIQDFYTTQAGVLDTEGKFFAKYVEYEVVDEQTSNKLDAPYYTINSFIGKGGKVVMPAYLDVNGQKNVPIYSVTADGFQFEGNPTNGIDRIIDLEISEGIAVIENEAFTNTNRLKSVKLPSTLRIIGEKAFMSSGLVGKLEIPKNVTEIGRTAFRDNAELTDIVILNPNVKFGAGVFDTSITIHGIKGSTAEEYATKNKIKFVEITAPSAPTVADFTDNGNYKFTVTDGYITGYERVDANKEYSLKITIPATIDGVAIKGVKEGAFDLGAEATSIFAVEIQEGITDISKNAFKGLKKLSYVKFPNSLKTIAEGAFIDTALAGDITLPEGLEKVEKDAFKNLGSISAVTVLSKTVVLEGTALPRNNPALIIYGYTGSTAEEWATNFKFAFEYLDGGAAEEPSDDKDKEPDYTEDPTEPDEDDEDDDEGTETIRKIIKQSNLALVIVIAVSMLLLAILLAAAVVVIVIIKKKLDEEEA